MPHKTVALRAGLGFIGKNNLLVTERYGCAVLLGKVLTTAPFITTSEEPQELKCGDCSICVDVCPTGALLGKTWSITTTRDETMRSSRENSALYVRNAWFSARIRLNMQADNAGFTEPGFCKYVRIDLENHEMSLSPRYFPFRKQEGKPFDVGCWRK